jgi:Raf kinase inhibitor-like YbhB/YbcL family protein
LKRANLLLLHSPALGPITGVVGARFSPKANMKLTSPDFREGGNIPELFTCDGQDTNPVLQIEGTPPSAKSLALIMDDPDAPSGCFTHWLVWGLAPELTGIAAGKLPPEAVQGVTDFGTNKYGGPCPPSGVHRYYFKLYALDIQLELPSRTRRQALDAAMKGHIVSEATLMGRYGRRGGKR